MKTQLKKAQEQEAVTFVKWNDQVYPHTYLYQVSISPHLKVQKHVCLFVPELFLSSVGSYKVLLAMNKDS